MSGESHIILDIDLDKVLTILRQASEVKMMEEYQSYIITSLDTHTLDFEDLKFMRANITAMRLIDPTSYDVTNGKIRTFLPLSLKKANFFSFSLFAQRFMIGNSVSVNFREISVYHPKVLKQKLLSIMVSVEKLGSEIKF